MCAAAPWAAHEDEAPTHEDGMKYLVASVRAWLVITSERVSSRWCGAPTDG